MLTEIKSLLDETALQSICDLCADAIWTSGAVSAGSRAARNKNNLEMDTSSPAWTHINELVVNRLYHHPVFQNSCLPLKVSACYVAKATTGMQFGEHIDNPIMGNAGQQYRSDIAVTIFISKPDDYRGGELVISTQYGEKQIKQKAGSAIAYPASSLHRVNPIESGERLVCVLWAQSLVREAAKREILLELSDARDALVSALPEAKVTSSIDHVHSNLVRMWSDT